MREDVLLKMVEPYIVDQKLSYTDFNERFKGYSDREKEEILNVLENNDIILTEEQILNDSIIDDDEIFIRAFHDDDENDYDDLSDFDNLHISSRDPYEGTINKWIANEVLCSEIQKGNRRAEQILCIQNRKLVYKYAIFYSKQSIGSLEFNDLVQVGMIGLLKAAQKFRHDIGTQFSTYAVWWIKQGMTREILDRASLIRIPVHMVEKINKIYKLYNKYKLQYEYINIINLISEELEMTNEDIEYCIKIRNYYTKHISLYAPVGENDQTPLIEILDIENEETVEDIISNKDLSARINEVLNTLPERDEKIIRLRFGIDNGRPMTLEEVGAELHLTRERIRQIEERALTRLRHSSRRDKLRHFLDK